MVYCGKPSKGCLRCRQKEIRCDQTKPACTQCTRLKATCPGYRDPLTVTFRDQTQDVERKVRSRQDRRVQKKDDSQVPEVAVFDQKLSRDTRLIPTNPSWPIEDQAAGFFFRNYVSVDPALFGGYLPTFNRMSGGEAIYMTLTSIGLAGLSHVKKAPDIMCVARSKYAEALDRTNMAVRDPARCKMDSTLLVVKLMSLFETVASSSYESLTSAANHTDGAIALLKIRGAESLQHEIGQRISVSLHGQIVVACRERRIRIPSFLQGAVRLQLRTDRKSVGGLADVDIQTCDIRAEMSENSSAICGATLSKLLRLDFELNTWFEDFSFGWSTITSSVRSDDIYEGSYHVYKDLWYASVLNGYRGSRITLNETILECLTSLRSSPISMPIVMEDLESRSSAVMLQLSKDIYSSIPFFLGYSQPEAPPQAFSGFSYGFTLLWPLRFAGRVPGISDARRQWIIRLLEKIGRTTGISQALGFAKALRKPQDPMSEWSADAGDGWNNLQNPRRYR